MVPVGRELVSFGGGVGGLRVGYGLRVDQRGWGCIPYLIVLQVPLAHTL